MMRFFIAFALFASGANFERFMMGDTDSFFGTRSLLLVLAVGGAVCGFYLMPSNCSGNRKGEA
jgi:hypothetical protein